MENNILGLHHITAIAGSAQNNFAFYTQVLGLRLVKKTVNFDDPGTYHFYFGNETGTPGTILTFFPWEGIGKGRAATGMATEINFSVPEGSLAFWKNRLEQAGAEHRGITERFGQGLLQLQDNDGLTLNLIAGKDDGRKPWTTADINADVAIRGFHGVVLNVDAVAPTGRVLTEIFGYRLLGQEGNMYRFITDAVDTANIVDIVEEPVAVKRANAAGTAHHVAFRVRNEAVLMRFREKIVNAGFRITEKIDRNYFFSLYFREPGGVLFEIATDNPGFTIDEPVSELGANLMLPAQYESSRGQIEAVLPVLEQS